MNVAILQGNLTRDPETHTTTGGMEITRISVAVNRRTKEGGVDYFNCTCFGKTAQIAGQYLVKGNPVLLEGAIKIDSYEKDGVKRPTIEILVNKLHLLPKGSAGTTATEDIPTSLPSDDDMPY